MSEFTNHKEDRIAGLINLFEGIQKGENLPKLVAGYQNLVERCIPADVAGFWIVK